MNDDLGPDADLSKDDQRLLDALIDCSFDPQRLDPPLDTLSEADHERVEKLLDLFGLLDDYPVDDPDDALVDATMLRISQSAASNRRQSARIDPDSEVERVASQRGGIFRFRLPDFISVAAVLLIGASITIPTLNHVRQRSIDLACETNLRQLGAGAVSYARDHNGDLPVIPAGLGFSGNWMNIATLIDNGYCADGHANCPGHHEPLQPSLSFQLLPAGRVTNIGDGDNRRALIADRNPLIDAIRVGRRISPQTNSLNHGRRGQNILMADNSIVWIPTPMFEGLDNIWLPEGVRDLSTVQPADIGDDLFFSH